MCSNFPDGSPQFLGTNFHFEQDENALQSILKNEGLPSSIIKTPKSNLKSIQCLPGSLVKYKDKFEFFEGSNGNIFSRPKTDTKLNSEERKHRALGTVVLNSKPQVRSSFKKSWLILIFKNIFQRIPPLKSPFKSFKANQRQTYSERKVQPFNLPPHR